ncbi:hypothetical protein [Dechloromonas denitrificans]|uniref:hypothetical protein n=1 Tax=Dechloromonas denitrificans TaxID=281362 RepID=UPI001CF83FEB|nr:hypothetical protein [Dechloromonas denitrificans]UCV02373.1 hypothetical protein KI611_14925 [Dechloromonas denitrificans]
MTKRYFCTLFDSNYLLKGVAMLRSLAKYCPDAYVYILCMDAKTEQILTQLDLPNIQCIPLSDLEDESLLLAKKERGIAEYCWTLSPCLPWYVLQNNPQIELITYLDSDLLFYSPVEDLFDEIGDASITIIEHRFSPRLKDREVNGRFCVEWVSFRRDDEGMACLSRWRDQCIEWCFYRLEEGRMGDQKYLDEWPHLYTSVRILQHLGAGIAPWNYSQYHFEKDRFGRITVNGAPLIFYHFHQFQLLDNGTFDRLSAFYTSECDEPLAVYEAYESQLNSVLSDVRVVEPGFSGGLKPFAQVAGRRWVQRFVPRRIKDVLHRLIRY